MRQLPFLIKYLMSHKILLTVVRKLYGFHNFVALFWPVILAEKKCIV